MLRIDHVVLASADLDATGERLWRDHGLASVHGGRHPAWGTANRIVPLGDQYVEALGVLDGEQAARSGFGRFMRDIAEQGDRWYTVAIRDDDLDATAARLGLDIEPGERELPDGRVLRWRRGLIDDPSHDPWLPFFIQWDVPDELHPGRTPAAHCVRPTGIARVDIGGDDRRLRPLLGNAGLPLRAVGGEPGLRAVVLSLTGRGIVTL
jgi:glyoxalase-like protein